MSTKRTFFIWKLCFVSLLVFITGCDDSFTPLEENDRYYFSIYGYLDLEADTQWIRIMPIRETIFYSTDSIDATVTLTNLNNSQTVVMNDSLFQIDVPQTEDDIAYWNFWTDVPIDPNTDYEIKAERSDGNFSSARITTPGSFPTPVVDTEEIYRYLDVSGVETIADIRVYWKVYNPTRNDTVIYEINRTENLIVTEGGEKIIRIREEYDLEYVENRSNSDGEIEIIDRQILIVSAGDDWINFPDLEKEVISLPEVTSNIENGIGYVVGASIKIIPYESCRDDVDPNVLVPCPTERPMWK